MADLGNPSLTLRQDLLWPDFNDISDNGCFGNSKNKVSKFYTYRFFAIHKTFTKFADGESKNGARMVLSPIYSQLLRLPEVNVDDLLNTKIEKLMIKDILDKNNSITPGSNGVT